MDPQGLGPIPTLPEGTGITYLAEGAANVVYRISVRYPTPPPGSLDLYGDETPPPAEIEVCDEYGRVEKVDLSIFDDKLLRVRKNLPTSLPCAISQAGFVHLIRPMFEEHQLINQVLVKLRPARVIERLNADLRGANPRPTSRQGTYLADDDYGLLITNMTPDLRGDVIEFKPKWLVQSPSAPKRSKRCRQCARIARANAEKVRRGQVPLKSFCPLDLVSNDWSDVMRVAEILLRPERSKYGVERFARWIHTTDLLRRLRDNQAEMDKIGVMSANPRDERFRLAMTLRDVTVYVRFPENPADDWAEIEARIGDLDIKCPDKAEYWRATERVLIEEGWYLGKEKSVDQQPLTCHLSPKRWELDD